jgi:hypothetical protein
VRDSSSRSLRAASDESGFKATFEFPEDYLGINVQSNFDFETEIFYSFSITSLASLYSCFTNKASFSFESLLNSLATMSATTFWKLKLCAGFISVPDDN